MSKAKSKSMSAMVNITSKQEQEKEKDDLARDQDSDPVVNDSKNVNHDLFKKVILEDYIYLKGRHLNKKIDDVILDRLCKKVEGKCFKVGYVQPGSVSIVKRSVGVLNNSSFEDITTYKVTYTVNVCNPVNGQIIQCEVGNIDKSQVICYVGTHDNSPVEIYLYKHFHVGNNDFIALKKGDVINVKIGISKWEYKDTQITSIAQFITMA
jgi:DNA-directed RNA polymerase subunit E'/Rpb7